MADAINFSHTFGPQVGPVPLSFLDDNFGNAGAAIGNLNTFSNYVADTGSVNAYVATFGAGITATLTAGLRVQFLATNTNTGPSTLNAAGLGAINIKNIDGSSLTAGQIQANGITDVIYDGTEFLLLNVAPVSGLWTPVLQFGGATTGITYSTQAGRYTSIGLLVVAWFDILLSSKGSASGAATINGLPISTNGNAGRMPFSIYFFNMTSSFTSMLGSFTSGPLIAITGVGTAATGQGGVANTDFANTSQIHGAFVYSTA